ncbi:hypothetical protein [Myxacorys almedinensis]|uniref:Uncharacterized protein n=1 Tax=Myxacorys almedinensis A TaxID=2690445 RepID=A0A8J7Z378_9CYAN|nr:hypothetical protein [Myxacorys almedinensis]NDJ18909.1 hypothetical protein [Myxacorys almedinensis A]
MVSEGVEGWREMLPVHPSTHRQSGAGDPKQSIKLVFVGAASDRAAKLLTVESKVPHDLMIDFDYE